MTTPSIAIALAEFNTPVTEQLLSAALTTLQKGGGLAPEEVPVIRVPGAFELPLAAQQLLDSFPYDAVICLGAVIRGETPHFDYVSQQCAAGIMDVSLASNTPVIFGVLTTDNAEQAFARSGTEKNKGRDAALAALQMIQNAQQLLPATELVNS